MSLSIILIIAFSAFMHVGWNLISKKQNPSPAFLLLVGLVTMIVMSPALFFSYDLIEKFPPRVWWLLLSTGISQAVYFTCLAQSYRRSEMSLAYPLIRALPVIFVPLVFLGLGKGSEIAPLDFALMGIICLSCFLLPLQKWSDFKLSLYKDKSLLWALVAAFGTTGYTIIDSEALRQLNATLSSSSSRIQIVTLYAFLEYLSLSLCLGLDILCVKSQRSLFDQALRTQKKAYIAAGCLCSINYGLILLAMSYGDNASYISAFRQIGIPLGALVAIKALDESCSTPKKVGLCILSTALILLAL